MIVIIVVVVVVDEVAAQHLAAKPNCGLLLLIW